MRYKCTLLKQIITFSKNELQLPCRLAFITMYAQLSHACDKYVQQTCQIYK